MHWYYLILTLPITANIINVHEKACFRINAEQAFIILRKPLALPTEILHKKAFSFMHRAIKYHAQKASM